MHFPPRFALHAIHPNEATAVPSPEPYEPLTPVRLDDFVLAPTPLRDETDRWAALLDHMRQTRELQHMQAPRVSPPPEMPAGLDVHRRDADRDTRASVEAMLNAFGESRDPQATLSEMRLYITTMSSDPEDADAQQLKAHALRTLSAQRRPATATVEREEWLGIADPENTYYVGAAARVSLPALDVCAALWEALKTLPPQSLEAARVMFVSALGAAQQRDFSGWFSHVCAPAQFQLIATFLQHWFTQYIHVVPEIKAPRHYVRVLFDDVERNYGKVYRNPLDPEADWQLPPHTHSPIRKRALEAWDDARLTEKSLEQRSYLTRAQVYHRSVELNAGIAKLLRFYGIAWSRPASPPKATVKVPAFDLAETLVVRMPSPPRAENALASVHPLDPHQKVPEKEARRICCGFKKDNPENRPKDAKLNQFYCDAMNEGRVEFANRPEMAKFDDHIRTFLQWEYDFIPVV